MSEIVPYRRSAAAASIAGALVNHYGKKAGKMALRVIEDYMAKPKQVKSAPKQVKLTNSGVRPITNTNNAPLAKGSSMMSKSAKIKKTSKGVVVSHTELVTGSIPGSNSYAVATGYTLNPGLSDTFPWVSVQAKQYEMYRFIDVWFEYVPIASASTQGDIGLIPEYNATAGPPASEREAFDHQGAVIGSVWQPMRLKFDQKKMHAIGPYRYVRSGNVAGDYKTFDSGKVWIITNNETSLAAVGKLFVHYTIEFINPILDSLTIPTASNTSIFHNPINQTFSNGVPSGLECAGTDANPLNIIATAGKFILPKGAYHCMYSATFSNSANETFSVGVVCKVDGFTIVGTGQFNRQVGTATGSYANVSGQAYVVSTGDSELTIEVTLYGATGTLLAPADTQVSFRIA